MEYFCDAFRHLVCVPYSVENLHKMAEDLGIKRCWFHNGSYAHYDIPKRMVTKILDRVNFVPGKAILEIVKGR
jgi:hypothetical protein